MNTCEDEERRPGTHLPVYWLVMSLRTVTTCDLVLWTSASATAPSTNIATHTRFASLCRVNVQKY